MTKLNKGRDKDSDFPAIYLIIFLGWVSLLILSFYSSSDQIQTQRTYYKHFLFIGLIPALIAKLGGVPNWIIIPAVFILSFLWDSFDVSIAGLDMNVLFSLIGCIVGILVAGEFKEKGSSVSKNGNDG